MNESDPLRDRLVDAASQVKLRFTEVAALAGGLPPSAYRYAAWWSNNPTRYAQAQAWLDAGHRVAEIDLDRERVTFAHRR